MREATNRLAAAREFINAAISARREGWLRAAVGNAAEAAIAAADVIGYAHIGERSASSSHRAALAVLEESRSDEVLKDDLDWLLGAKNPAQYLEDWACDDDLADEALTRARRLVVAAEDAFLAAGRDGWPYSTVNEKGEQPKAD
jgi:HEPN domain-containing protein